MVNCLYTCINCLSKSTFYTKVTKQNKKVRMGSKKSKEKECQRTLEKFNNYLVILYGSHSGGILKR